MSEPTICPGCGADLYHYAGCSHAVGLPDEPSAGAVAAAKSSLENCIGEDARDDIAMMLCAAYAAERRNQNV